MQNSKPAGGVILDADCSFVVMRTEEIRKRAFASHPDFLSFLVGGRGFEPPTPARLFRVQYFIWTPISMTFDDGMFK